MTENAPMATTGSELVMVVPPLLFYCGWSPRDQPKTGSWQGPSGFRTLSHGDHGVPYGPDRWVFLYLAAKVATHGRQFRGTLREITETFKLRWSAPCTLASLWRVISCSIETRVAGEELSPRYILVERFRLLADNAFEVTASKKFAAEVKHGVPYSLEHARAMGRSYATLDLYLWTQWALRAGLDRVLAPRKLFCLARTPYKRYQQLRDRCERICAVWPECPFVWCPERRTLALRHRGVARRRPVAQEAEQADSRSTAPAIPHPGSRFTALTHAEPTASRRIVPVPPWKQRKPEPRSLNGSRLDRLESLLTRSERLSQPHHAGNSHIGARPIPTLAPITSTHGATASPRPGATPTRRPTPSPATTNKGDAIPPPWFPQIIAMAQTFLTAVMSFQPQTPPSGDQPAPPGQDDDAPPSSGDPPKT